MAEPPVIHLCEMGSEGRDCTHCGVRIYGLGCGDPKQCVLYQRTRAERAEKVLSDIVTKATPFGVQDGDFIASYILPTGPMHRAIPLLAEQGVHVRPMGEPED
jgi:hypothetical protein